MLKKKFWDDLLQYIAIIILIYQSGSPFFVIIHYKYSVMLVFALMAVITFLIKKNNLSISKRKVVVLLWIAACMIVSVINAGVLSDAYLAVFLQICMGLLLSEFCEFEAFKRKYFHVISVFAGISLICFGLLLINPEIMLLLPKQEGGVALYYHNAYVHLFGSYKRDVFVPFMRNNGIFWEPGCYQAFLNLGMVFAMDKYRNHGFTKLDWVKVIVIVVTIATTYSTMGYAVLCVIILANCKAVLHVIKRYRYLFAAAVCVCVVVILSIGAGDVGTNYGFGIDFFINKVSTEAAGGLFFTRIDLDHIDILFENSKAFFGISPDAYDGVYPELANSVLHTAITLGVPFTVILLVMYFGFAKRLQGANKWLIYAAVVFCFFNEMLFWRPLFMCLAWYGTKSFCWGTETLSSSKNLRLSE